MSGCLVLFVLLCPVGEVGELFVEVDVLLSAAFSQLVESRAVHLRSRIRERIVLFYGTIAARTYEQVSLTLDAFL